MWGTLRITLMVLLVAVIFVACLICIAMPYPAQAITCLPSAKAVWSEHPGSHATWKRDQSGGKCWYAKGDRIRHVHIPIPKERPIYYHEYNDFPLITPAQYIEIGFKAMELK